MYYSCIKGTMTQGSTIEEIIRFHNHPTITKEHLEELVQGFNELNPRVQPGTEVEVPIMWEYVKLKENSQP